MRSADQLQVVDVYKLHVVLADREMKEKIVTTANEIIQIFPLENK